jgi:TonB family protein
MTNVHKLSILVVGVLGLALIVPALGQEQGSRKAVVRVTPKYPELAKKMHLAGKVKIEVKVAPNGAVTKTSVVGGHPVLLQPAEEAAKQWKFEPGDQSTEIIVFTFTGDE